MMWDDSEDGGGSLVGPSRGSIASFYISYLINLQQINPLKYNIPWWRHLHASRPEMPDVDIDTEEVELASEQIRYQGITAGINGQFDRMRSVIK